MPTCNLASWFHFLACYVLHLCMSYISHVTCYICIRVILSDVTCYIYIWVIPRMLRVTCYIYVLLSDVTCYIYIWVISHVARYMLHLRFTCYIYIYMCVREREDITSKTNILIQLWLKTSREHANESLVEKEKTTHTRPMWNHHSCALLTTMLFDCYQKSEIFEINYDSLKF